MLTRGYQGNKVNTFIESVQLREDWISKERQQNKIKCLIKKK